MKGVQVELFRAESVVLGRATLVRTVLRSLFTAWRVGQDNYRSAYDSSQQLLMLCI